MVLAGAFGLIIGAALGLLGAGGSILAVPALIYGVGQPVAAALFGSLLVVAISAAGKTARSLEIASTPSTLCSRTASTTLATSVKSTLTHTSAISKPS
jgi:hypothetical protein